MKRNDWILAVTVLIYSLLFYHQTAGINFLLFNLVIVAALIIRDSTLFKKRNWLIAATGSILSAVCVCIHGNLLTVVANLISLSILSGISCNTNSSVVFSLLFSAYSYLSSPVFMVLDYLERRARETMEKAGPSRKLILIIAPLLITIVFFFMYRSSNALFDALASKIKFDFISWEWVLFTLLGFVLLYGFFYYKRVDEFVGLDDNTNVDLSPVQNTTSHFFGREFSMNDENFSGILLFALLNVLVLIVNALDINFLLGGEKLPLGVSYAEFIHQGVAMLIVSIIFAISIILFYFRGGLNFYKDNKTIKALACLWVAQNAFMLISNAIRNNMCVHEYGLSYKHIGVYVYLLLTLVGLATTLIKLLKAKNNMYLFRKNGWIFYGLLIIFSFPDWDRMITVYNISHIKKVNTEYLLSLSNSGLADMLPAYTMSVNAQGPMKDSARLSIDWYSTRLYQALYAHEFSDWRSWCYDDSRLFNDVASKSFTDRITVLDIMETDMIDDSLNMLNMFDHLTELHLHSKGIYSVKHLNKLKQLTILDMSNTGLFDISGIGVFSNLQYLNISGTRIYDYSPLYQLKNLQKLKVGYYSNISDDEVKEIKKNLPNLVIERA